MNILKLIKSLLKGEQMKITKIPALECPLCKSRKVTIFDHVMIKCDDCRQSTLYKKPKEVTSEDGFTTFEMLRYIACLYIFIGLMFWLYAFYAFVTDAETKPEPKPEKEYKQTVSVGECYAHKNECIKDAPKWENEKITQTVVVITDKGIKNVKTIHIHMSCDGESIVENTTYPWIDGIDSFTGKNPYYEWVSCPDLVMKALNGK